MYWLYVLTFPNGKRYFGLTIRPQRRESDHRWALKSRTRLRAAIKKYGPKSFTFKLLCCGNEEYIADLETMAIEHFRTRDPDFGYNMAPGGKISPMSDPEIAARSGMSQRGKVLSDEHRAKLVSALKRRPKITPETRAKLSASLRARPLSIYLRGPQHPNFGKTITFADPEAHAEACSRAKKGKPRRPESVAKGRASLMGHPVSDETRAKISAARKGKSNGPRSAETRTKMRAAALSRYARERAEKSGAQLSLI